MQVLMFSATLHSEEVRSTASKICQNPTLVDLKVPLNPYQEDCNVLLKLRRPEAL